MPARMLRVRPTASAVCGTGWGRMGGEGGRAPPRMEYRILTSTCSCWCSARGVLRTRRIAIHTLQSPITEADGWAASYAPSPRFRPVRLPALAVKRMPPLYSRSQSSQSERVPPPGLLLAGGPRAVNTVRIHRIARRSGVSIAGLPAGRLRPRQVKRLSCRIGISNVDPLATSASAGL